MSGPLPRSAALTAEIEQAAGVARRLGHRRLGSEHLLLALVEQPLGPVAAVVRALNLDHGSISRAVHDLMPGSGRPTEGDVLLTESAATALQAAEAVAEQMGAAEVDTDHLLVGIARQQTGLGARILLDAGITAAKARQVVEREAKERLTGACAACGQALEAAWRFCPHCGQARTVVSAAS